MAVLLGAISKYDSVLLSKEIERLKSRKKRLDNAIKMGKSKEIILANQYAFLKKLKQVELLSKKSS